MGTGYPKQQDLPGRRASFGQMHQSDRLQKSHRGNDPDDREKLGESYLLPDNRPF